MAYGESLPYLNPCSPEKVAALLQPHIRHDARLADIGCGRGDTLQWLAAHTAYELHGVESDSEMLAFAERQCPSVALVYGEADSLPYADGYVDALLMECVFSLLTDPAKAIAELARVIRQQGILLITDLYTRLDAHVQIDQNELLKNLYTRAEMEAYFNAQAGGRWALLPDGFMDCTKELQTMAAQMIMDDKTNDGRNRETLKTLRVAKVGYGMWLWRRV